MARRSPGDVEIGMHGCTYVGAVILLFLMAVVLLVAGFLQDVPREVSLTAALPMGLAILFTWLVRRARAKGAGRKRGLISFTGGRKVPFIKVWCWLFFGPLVLAGAGLSAFFSAPTVAD